MTWTDFFKWIAIIYIPYYAINIAYDIYQYHKKKKKENDSYPIIYDVSHIFANDVQPKVVHVENSTPPANPVHKEQLKGEGGEMSPSELLKALNRESLDVGMRIFSRK